MRFLLSKTPPPNKRKLVQSSAQSSRFGQHGCGNCGCVLRLQVELDRQHRIVNANYTAKRILPGLQSSNDRLWATESPCAALHKLSSQTTHFLTNSYLHQVQNLVHTSPSLQKLHQPSTGCYNLLHSTLHLLCHQYLPSYQPAIPDKSNSDSYPTYAPPIVPEEEERETLPNDDWVSYVDATSEVAN